MHYRTAGHKGSTQLSQDAPKSAENGSLSPVILVGYCIYQERSQIVM